MRGGVCRALLLLLPLRHGGLLLVVGHLALHLLLLEAHPGPQRLLGALLGELLSRQVALAHLARHRAHLARSGNLLLRRDLGPATGGVHPHRRALLLRHALRHELIGCPAADAGGLLRRGQAGLAEPPLHLRPRERGAGAVGHGLPAAVHVALHPTRLLPLSGVGVGGVEPVLVALREVRAPLLGGVRAAPVLVVVPVGGGLDVGVRRRLGDLLRARLVERGDAASCQRGACDQEREGHNRVLPFSAFSTPNLPPISRERPW